jgi:DNA-binding NarL/FixJ family response regulator
MADGRSAKQMASAMNLSIHTVRSHQRNLYRTLGVGSLAPSSERGSWGCFRCHPTSKVVASPQPRHTAQMSLTQRAP